MPEHHYQVTLQPIPDAASAADAGTLPLSFDVSNHDDILAVLARVQRSGVLPAEQITPFVIGLKLFGKVLIENRQHPLFAEFAPHFGDFMKHLKGMVKK